jgi:hypothetical protein
VLACNRVDSSARYPDSYCHCKNKYSSVKGKKEVNIGSYKRPEGPEQINLRNLPARQRG